jgi:hypothetical protein
MRSRFTVLFIALLAGFQSPFASAQEFPGLARPIVNSDAAWQFYGQQPPTAGDFGPEQAPLMAGPDKVCTDGCASNCFDFNLCCYPGVYGQVDGLFWHRIGSGCEQTIVLNTTTGDSVLNTRDLDFNVTGGPRVLIGWQPDPCRCPHCCAWEFTYFGLLDWSADSVAVGSGDLAIPGDLGLVTNNFLLADVIGASYRAEMHNFELNCIKSCCPSDCLRLDFIAGLRYISLDEDFTITGQDFDEGTSTYYVNADNDLFGVQLGGRLRRAWCRWAVELTGKAGIFWNDAQQDQLITDSPGGFVVRDNGGSEDVAAMVAELGVVLIRPINDRWNFRIGYNLFGVGGVALAPNQLDFSLAGGTNVDSSGWFLAHGGLIGLESRW